MFSSFFQAWFILNMNLTFHKLIFTNSRIITNLKIFRSFRSSDLTWVEIGVDACLFVCVCLVGFFHPAILLRTVRIYAKSCLKIFTHQAVFIVFPCLGYQCCYSIHSIQYKRILSSEQKHKLKHTTHTVHKTACTNGLYEAQMGYVKHRSLQILFI